MKTKQLNFYIFLAITMSFLTACSEVKNTAKKGRSSVKNDSLITKAAVADLEKNINRQAIYFKASGTEPFWGLQITGENVTFTSLSEGFEKFQTPHKEPIRAMDANVKMYRLVMEKGDMKIQMAQMLCTDAMSGKENKYEITVELKRNIDKEFKTFKGCGHYITDYRLHDIWTLEEMNGQPLHVQQYGKERPRIEINSSQNSFMGVSGNHDINGKIFFEKGLLRFTDIEKTKNGNKAEDGFIKNLAATTGYTIENNRLLLFNPSGQLLKFKKAD